MKSGKIPNKKTKENNEEPEIYAIRKPGDNRPFERRDFLKGLSILAGSTLVGCGRNIKSEINEDSESVFDPKEYEGERIDSESCGDLVAHSESINSVCFSPDGKLLASCSDDDTIKIWTVSTGKLKQTLKGQGSEVNSVCFSPDGKTLFYGGNDKIIAAYSISSGKVLHTYSGHVGSILTICCSPDGKICASGSADNTIKLWSVSKGNIIETFYEHEQSVNTLHFSTDGGILVSGSSDGTIKMWSVENLNLIKSLEGHAYGVDCVRFSPDGKMLVSSGRGSYFTESNSIKFWSLPDALLQNTIEALSEGAVTSLDFSTDGTFLASGNKDGSIGFWSYPEGKLWKTLDHPGEVNAVNFSSQGKMLASGSSNKTIKLWEWASYGEIEPDTNFDRCFEKMSPIVYANSGYVIGSKLDAKKLEVIDLKEKKLTHNINGYLYNISSVLISKDSKYAIAGNSKGRIKWCEIENEKTNGNFKANDEAINQISIINNNSTLITTGIDEKIRIWSFPDAVLIKELAGSYIAFNQGEDVYAILNESNSVTIGSAVDFTTMKEFRFEGIVSAVSFSPVTDQLFLGSQSGIAIYDYQNEKVVTTYDSEFRVLDIAISYDEKYLAFAYNTHKYGSYNGFSIIDLEQNLLVKSMTFSEDVRPVIRFLEDGRLLYVNDEIMIFEFTDFEEDLLLSSCLYDKDELEEGTQGIRYRAGSGYSTGTVTRTLPCGSPIPPGAVCTCNCVTVGNPKTYYTSPSYYTLTYWYPN